MDAETVVAQVQADVARAASANVVGAVETGTAIVASEVSAVSEQLAEHQEASEERHEEILGDTGWLRNAVDQLLTLGPTIQGQIAGLQAAVTAQLTAMQTQLAALAANPNTSTATSPSIPPAEVVTEIVEPESASADAAGSQAPKTKRRRQVI